MRKETDYRYQIQKSSSKIKKIRLVISYSSSYCYSPGIYSGPVKESIKWEYTGSRLICLL